MSPALLWLDSDLYSSIIITECDFPVCEECHFCFDGRSFGTSDPLLDSTLILNLNQSYIFRIRLIRLCWSLYNPFYNFIMLVLYSNLLNICFIYVSDQFRQLFSFFLFSRVFSCFCYRGIYFERFPLFHHLLQFFFPLNELPNQLGIIRHALSKHMVIYWKCWYIFLLLRYCN